MIQDRRPGGFRLVMVTPGEAEFTLYPENHADAVREPRQRNILGRSRLARLIRQDRDRSPAGPGQRWIGMTSGNSHPEYTMRRRVGKDAPWRHSADLKLAALAHDVKISRSSSRSRRPSW